jgi:diguanylate cyclase (GGDEF)-like protein
MVTGILIFGVLNLALGFGLAVYFHRAPVAYADRPVLLDDPIEVKPAAAEALVIEPPTPEPPAPELPVEPSPEPETTIDQVAPEPPAEQPIVAPAPPPEVVTTAPTIDVAEEIPEGWFDLLGDVGECRSFVEASVQVLQLEVGRYRGQLIEIDDRVRANLAHPVPDAIEQILADLRRVNQDWLARQADAAGNLVARKDSLGNFAMLAARLEAVLLHQAAQIETTCSNIDILDFKSDVAAGHKRLIFELCKLLDVAHGLRDRMHESLIAIMTVEGRLDQLDPQLQADTLTGVLNRSGLEAALHDWWREAGTHKRLASLALVDIDRFGRFNEAFGAQASDGLIAAVGHLLDAALHKSRGYDAVARYDGQRLAVFAADTGPWHTANTLERVRQTIAVSTFELDDQELTLTISCGVTGVSRNDNIESLFERAERALWHAKRSGRNQTSIEEGQGPIPVEPPVLEVQGKVVRIAKEVKSGE